MRYRAEIDGLRAVAILPVVLFHAGFSAFGGGFVGVDVFFVISGYLITTILRDELTHGTVDLRRFYERRARRILPALFVVMAVSTVLAGRFFVPEDMKAFSESLVAVPIFLSNVLFWQQSGYFDGAVELKPLLHTWSLSVEEQYYIVFPLVMLCLWRWGQRGLCACLGVAALLSLGLAEWGVSNKPSATFYLLPTRGWEILIGSLAALLAHRVVLPQSSIAREFAGLSGLGLILYSVFSFDENTPFPGVAALVPTLGALLILLFGTLDTWVGRVLAFRPIAFVGLVSYSFYLWHQPVFAFSKYHREPTSLVMLGLVILSFALGVISWKFIERPFRREGVVSIKIFAPACIFVGGVYVALGLWGYSQQGFEKSWYTRQAPDTQRVYDIVKASSTVNSADDNDCRFSVPKLSGEIRKRLLACRAKYGPGYAVIGDSHAIDLFGVVTTSDSKHKFIFGLARGSCRPHTKNKQCSYDEFSKFVREHDDLFASVVFEQAGFYLLRTDTKQGSRNLISGIPLDSPVIGVYPDLEPIHADLVYLRELSQHVKVVWFGPRVEPHINKSLMISSKCDASFSLRRNQYETYEKLDETIAAEAEKFGVNYLSQITSFKFNFAHDLLDCEGLYWDDGDHLSPAGEIRFGKRFNLIEFLAKLDARHEQ